MKEDGEEEIDQGEEADEKVLMKSIFVTFIFVSSVKFKSICTDNAYVLY